MQRIIDALNNVPTDGGYCQGYTVTVLGGAVHAYDKGLGIHHAIVPGAAKGSLVVYCSEASVPEYTNEDEFIESLYPH